MAGLAAGQGGGGPTLTYALQGNWGTGFQAGLVVTNNGTSAVTSWHLQFDYTHGITSVWDAVVVSHVGNTWTIAGPGWAPDLPPGGSHSFGFVAATNGPMVDPINCTLNGVPCAVNGVISGGGGGCGGTSNFVLPPAGGLRARQQARGRVLHVVERVWTQLPRSDDPGGAALAHQLRFREDLRGRPDRARRSVRGRRQVLSRRQLGGGGAAGVVPPAPDPEGRPSPGSRR